MQWTPDLSVGVEKIDEQHRELFSRIGKLVEAIKSQTCKYEIGPTLKFLEAYIIEHFSDEEGLMRGVDYPAYESHKALHDRFVSDFEVLKKELESETSNYNKSAYTNKMVVDWILEHIRQRDSALGVFINRKGGSK